MQRPDIFIIPTTVGRIRRFQSRDLTTSVAQTIIYPYQITDSSSPLLSFLPRGDRWTHVALKDPPTHTHTLPTPPELFHIWSLPPVFWSSTCKCWPPQATPPPAPPVSLHRCQTDVYALMCRFKLHSVWFMQRHRPPSRRSSCTPTCCLLHVCNPQAGIVCTLSAYSFASGCWSTSCCIDCKCLP